MKTVQDLLDSIPKHDIAATNPDATVFEAIDQMAKGNYGALPVLFGEELVGIFSERDYVRKVELLGRSSKTTTVGEIMTPNPIVVTPEQSLEDCMTHMTERGFRHLPVVSNGKLFGFLSMKDALKNVLRSREEFLHDAVDMGVRKDTANALEKSREVQTLVSTFKESISPLHRALDELKRTGDKDVPSTQHAITELGRVIQNLDDKTRPVLLRQEQRRKMSQTKVLLANGNRAEEIIAKLALGGTGVTLHTACSEEAALNFMKDHDYDIVCVNHEFIDIAEKARAKNDKVNTVFLTSEDADSYLAQIKLYPFLSNVVSQSEGDRAFTIKSILSTVSKITNSDYFGLEKYLSWGTEIREHKVSKSAERRQIIAEMANTLSELGLRRTLVSRCENVAEELLMNAIYDAPIDPKGKHLYNHLDRTEAIELAPNEQPVFRYGCDGMFLGISVRDPFGSIDRETVLEYLDSCFSGRETPLHKNKGGGGHGVFIILRSANMTIFNVQKGVSTEVITLFDLEPKQSGKQKTSSFQYFTV